MLSVAEMLKTSEAAIVSGVSLRDVNRVIDEQILPDAFISLDNGRYVLAGACSLIAFYFTSAQRLTADERLAVIRIAQRRLVHSLDRPWAALLREDWTVRDDFLTIDLLPFMKGSCERLNDLIAAREMVTVSPDILSSTPIIRGTRVPVYDVAASVAAGHPTERILAAWPSLNTEKIRLAAIYAEANPLRGRPRAAAHLPEGAVIITDRRVPRAKKAG